MGSVFRDFHEAQRMGNGRLLASCLVPVNTADDPNRLQSISQFSNHQTVQADLRYLLVQNQNAFKLPKPQANAWIDIFTAYWKCTRELYLLESGTGGDWDAAFKAYSQVCRYLVRGYSNFQFEAWTVPCLYTAGKYLRMIAIRTDEECQDTSLTAADSLSDDVVQVNSKERLEIAAQTLQQMFNTCRTDDSDISESRKWGIYSMSNLLFKTFFTLNKISLTKGIIRALDPEQLALPPFTAFPKSQRCTFAYYRGIIEFLQEHYSEAEKYLSEALSICHRDAMKNREQILTYLIPAHMIVQQQLPQPALLAQHPNLQMTFGPLCDAIKKGSLTAFDQALSDAEPEFVKRRVYLTLERTRDLCMRNLFRKVYLAAGMEESKDAKTGEISQIRRTRIRIEEFEAGIRVSYRPVNDAQAKPVMMDRDEVECCLANMIYKGHMKGYIAREQGKVVLSKGNNAFPGTLV